MKGKISRMIILCTWLLIFGVHGGWSQKTASQQPPEHIIKEALRFAEGRKFSIPKRKSRSAWKEYYAFIGEKVYIEVDAITGKVTFVLYSAPGPLISKEKLIDIDEIERRLKAWLDEKGIDLKGWNLESRKVFDERIQFEWTKRSPKGVRLPSVLSVNVWVSDKGVEIDSIFFVDRPVEVSLEPIIQEEEAMKIATEAAKLRQPKVVGKELSVWFNEKGQQELRWEVTLEENAIRKKL